MPPLILFGRQWRIATDDFVYPSVIELGLRTGWIVVIAVVLGFHVNEANYLTCLGAEYRSTTVYLVTTLVLLLTSCINLILLATHSSRGRMWEPASAVPHPRRRVSLFLYLNIMLTVSEFIWTMVGTFFALKDLLRCMADDGVRGAIIAVLVVVFLTYIILFFKIGAALTVFRPFGKHDASEELSLLIENRQLAQRQETELNYRGLRCLMPCTNDEDRIQAFRDIASLLSKVFHDSDLVPSDIMAGLVLIHHKHRLERVYRLGSGLPPPDLNSSSVVMSEVGELKHYYKYASAAYGYWWYIIDSPCIHLGALGGYLSCCPCVPCVRREVGGVVKGDACYCNKAAALAMLQIDEEDMIVFDNRNKVQEVPYFLVADHSQQSLVVGIRGTLSLHDMMTDLRGEPAPMGDILPEGGDQVNREWKGHKGMLEAARYVYLRLLGLPVNTAEEKAGSRSERVDQLSLALSQHPGYSLVVTGHSLGAGTAAILAFLLRFKFPEKNVKCYAYSPPGGLLSHQAAVESEKFTLSLVVGDDVIPRTSLTNIARLSGDIRSVCEKCELPKFKLIGHAVLGCCPFSCLGSTVLEDEVGRLFPFSTTSTHHSGEGGDTRSLDIVSIERVESIDREENSTPVHSNSGSDNSSRQLLSPRSREVAEPPAVAVRATLQAAMAVQYDPMYLPGRIYFIDPVEDSDNVRLTVEDREHFSEIIVSPRMLLDHLPNFISRVLDKIPE